MKSVFHIPHFARRSLSASIKTDGAPVEQLFSCQIVRTKWLQLMSQRSSPACCRNILAVVKVGRECGFRVTASVCLLGTGVSSQRTERCFHWCLQIKCAIARNRSQYTFLSGHAAPLKLVKVPRGPIAAREGMSTPGPRYSNPHLPLRRRIHSRHNRCGEATFALAQNFVAVWATRDTPGETINPQSVFEPQARNRSRSVALSPQRRPQM